MVPLPFLFFSKRVHNWNVRYDFKRFRIPCSVNMWIQDPGVSLICIINLPGHPMRCDDSILYLVMVRECRIWVPYLHHSHPSLSSLQFLLPASCFNEFLPRTMIETWKQNPLSYLVALIIVFITATEYKLECIYWSVKCYDRT